MVALDVHYTGQRAFAAAVVFEDWTSPSPTRSHTCEVPEVEPYQPGRFFLRELPCLTTALSALELSPSLVLIDGHVWLSTDKPGLGAHLWEALGRSVPVVGVAKSAWHQTEIALPILRGDSQRPLWVTAQGLDAEDAAARVRSMHGLHRIPTLLKLADSLCRAATSRRIPGSEGG